MHNENEKATGEDIHPIIKKLGETVKEDAESQEKNEDAAAEKNLDESELNPEETQDEKNKELTLKEDFPIKEEKIDGFVCSSINDVELLLEKELQDVESQDDFFLKFKISPKIIADFISLKDILDNLFNKHIGSSGAPAWSKILDLFLSYRNGETAITNHLKWLDKMKERGWTYGEKFDIQNKKSPDIKKWEELPEDFQRRYQLYEIIIKDILAIHG